MSLYIVNGIGTRNTSVLGVYESRGEAEANIRQHMSDVQNKLRGVVRYDRYDVFLRKIGAASESEPVVTINAPKKS